MSKLIEALKIFLKYGDPTFPTHCEHDVMYVMVDPGNVTDEDKAALAALSFEADDGEGHFYSFTYGSA